MAARYSTVVLLVVLMSSSAFSVLNQRVKRDKGGHHHQHAPIGSQQQYAPQRPAYLPVPLPIHLQAASVILPAPPTQSYQPQGGYQQAGSYQQPQQYPAAPPQPAYQPLPPPPQQPQYQPPPAPVYQPQPQFQPPPPAPYQPPQQPEYQQPAPQQYVPPAAPAPQEYAPVAPAPVAPAPSYQSAPVEPLPVPLYARQPQQQQQQAPESYAQTQEYVAPAPELSSGSQYAPVEENAAPTYDSNHQEAQQSYAQSEPVTIPPVADESSSYSTAAPVQQVDQDINTNAISSAPAPEAGSSSTTGTSGSQWTEGSIPWTLEKLGLNTLNDLLVLSGLDEQFDKEGPFTVFVPVDQAFEILIQKFGGMEKATEEFNKNPDVLNSLLKHHVVAGSVPSSALQNNGVLQSLLSTPLRVKFYESEDSEWRPLKVITVNGARVVRPDIQATNGVIHIIDRVIFPVPQADIYNTLKNDPQQRYTTLVSAIDRAGLTSVLANPTAGPYTVFAPTNKAFSLISRAELNNILEDPAKLTKLLQRHVVQDLIYTSGLQGFQKAYALDFEILYIYHAKGMTKVNGANVIDQDMTTLNGVIHTIDSVLGLY